MVLRTPYIATYSVHDYTMPSVKYRDKHDTGAGVIFRIRHLRYEMRYEIRIGLSNLRSTLPSIDVLAHWFEWRILPPIGTIRVIHPQPPEVGRTTYKWADKMSMVQFEPWESSLSYRVEYHGLSYHTPHDRHSMIISGRVLNFETMSDGIWRVMIVHVLS